MQKLTWDTVALLLIQYGIPTADAIVRKWLNGEPVTEAQWNEIRAIAGQTAKDVTKRKLVEAGIDPESEQGKLIIGLAS